MRKRLPVAPGSDEVVTVSAYTRVYQLHPDASYEPTKRNVARIVYCGVCGRRFPIMTGEHPFYRLHQGRIWYMCDEHKHAKVAYPKAKEEG